jgi:hypothetical protein
LGNRVRQDETDDGTALWPIDSRGRAAMSDGDRHDDGETQTGTALIA